MSAKTNPANDVAVFRIEERSFSAMNPLLVYIYTSQVVEVQLPFVDQYTIFSFDVF